MAKYSRFDARNKKKTRDKYRKDSSKNKFSLSSSRTPLSSEREVVDYETIDISSIRGRQKI